MTNNSVYIFTEKDMSLTMKAAIANVFQVLMVSTNDSVFGLKMKGKDLFIESVRRTEFVVFLLTNAQNMNIKPP